MTPLKELQTKGWTGRLSEASTAINQAAQNLEKTYHKINLEASKNGSQTIPDPIKLLKRMSALEIALSNLQAECTMIANKRSEIVQTVMEQQYETVISVKELLEQTENDDPYSSRDDIVDENWESLIHSLEHQTKLGRTGTSIGTPMALSPPKTS